MPHPYVDAIRKGLFDILSQNENAVIFGEDVAVLGGRIGVTKGLLEHFGQDRVKDTPVSEEILVGIALGASNGGLRPIVEILNSDFLAIAFDDLWRSGLWQKKYQNTVSSDILVRTGFGAYAMKGPDFSSSAIAHIAAIPNVKIYAPAFPDDAYRLVKESFNEPGLKIFLEHKALYFAKEFSKFEKQSMRGQVLFISYSYVSVLCAKAAEILQSAGISSFLVDLGTIWPVPFERIYSCIQAADAVILVEECVPEAGIMNFIELEIRRKYPDKIIGRVHARDAIIPFGVNEQAVLPSAEDIAQKAFSLTR